VGFRLVYLVQSRSLKSFQFKMSCGSVVTRYTGCVTVAGRLRGQSLGSNGVMNFHFSISSRPALGTHPPIQWVSGTLSPEVKWQWHEADLSPTSAEVKKT
jgi:hypothetical protein